MTYLEAVINYLLGLIASMDKATLSTYFMSVVTMFSSLSFNEKMSLIGFAMGFLLGVFTALINWYYKHKTFQLAKKDSELTWGKNL